MSTELVYRLRTCAAAIVASTESGNPWNVERIANDAADLLIEASNLLDGPEDLGEPMAVIQDVETAAPTAQAVWGSHYLPPATPQPCPACGDTLSARTVKRDGRKLMLMCPKCPMVWEYGKHGA